MIIPYQNLTVVNGHPVDPQTLLIYWGPFQAGDEGVPISVYAFPTFTWQFTGYPAGDDINNPCVPVMQDRTVTVLGSNDHVCYGEVFTLAANPDGMVKRTGDPLRSGHADGSFLNLKPVIGGSYNPEGPDCGLLLFCAKLFGPRSP